MGCFDGSCSITNSPIGEGDRMVSVYLCKSSPFRGLANSNWGNTWEAISLPIRGEYDDYGGIVADKDTVSEDFFNNYLLPQFKDVTPPGHRGGSGKEVFVELTRMSHQVLPTSWANPYHLRCEGKGKVEWLGSHKDYDNKETHHLVEGEEIVEDMEYQLKKNNGTIVSQVFMHEAAYEKLVEIGRGLTFYPTYKPWEIKPSARAFLDDEKRKYLDPTPHVRPEYCEGMSDEDFDAFMEATRPKFDHRYYKPEDKYNQEFYPFMKLIDASDDGSEGKDFYREVTFMIRTMFIDCWNAQNVDPSDTEAVEYEEILLDKLIEYFYFKRGLHEVGRDLTPVASVCGQHQQTDQSKAMIEYMNVCIGIQQAKIDESDDEWDEEEDE